ncbi:MAG: uracil-DNA glycosylase [Chloroflexi bacterium]|nr:uracil-DNA glycosylase [Chloroflexota bacterium]
MPGAELAVIEREVVRCARCPRLVEWREAAARKPPRRYAGETYWAKPLPGFGDPEARILILGLAPAANGANRTGRIFTGDESGNFLWPALHAAGLANQATSVGAGDGLEATGAWITAAVKCAPPGNKPLPQERGNCAPYLVRELAALRNVRVVVALGAFAWDAALAAFAAMGHPTPSPRPRFSHGSDVRIGSWTLLGCYHVSQQNTYTGRLTRPMLDSVIRHATELAEE